MSLRYHKRINLGKGVGVNLSQSGISTSVRTNFGSIGSKGFSLKTGIPGLSYRGRFGKNFLPALLIYISIVAAVLVIYNLTRFIIYVLSWLYLRIRSTIIKK
jgi:hypothetical protein